MRFVFPDIFEDAYSEGTARTGQDTEVLRESQVPERARDLVDCGDRFAAEEKSPKLDLAISDVQESSVAASAFFAKDLKLIRVHRV